MFLLIWEKINCKLRLCSQQIYRNKTLRGIKVYNAEMTIYVFSPEALKTYISPQKPANKINLFEK